MSRSSEYHLGASSSLPPFPQLGGYSEEEKSDVIAKKKKATIEQHQQKVMAEGTPLEIQNKQEEKKKEESVTIQGRKEEEHLIQVEPEPDAPQMRGVVAQSSLNHSGSIAHSESGIMSVAVMIEQQDARQMQGAAPQNSSNISMPLNESEPGRAIMSYVVPIFLGVAILLIALHLFGVF